MITLSPLQKVILWDCVDDFTGLWQIIKQIHNDTPGLSPIDTKEETQRLLLPLLNEGLIQAGLLRKTGFSAWKLSPPQVLARISEEWSTLNREPNLGEVAWFEITQRGIGLLYEMDPDALRKQPPRLK